MEIDNHAGATRARFITIAPGQELTYQKKAAEAADYVLAGYPADLTNYPFINAEASSTGKTPTETADAIITQELAWRIAGAAIEGARMGGKKAVDDAVNLTEVNAAVENTKAVLDAIS